MSSYVKKGRKKKGQPPRTEFETPFDLLYPPREDMLRTNHRGSSCFHVGYYDPHGMRPCLCGTRPVIEQYVGDVDENGKRNIPAKQFVAICPRCEVRAWGHGSVEAVRKQWNRRHFVADTVTVRRRPETFSTDQCRVLSDKVVLLAMKDAVELIQKKHELMEELDDPHIGGFTRSAKYEELKHVRAEIIKLKRFFRDSPMMFERDEDAALSAIRKALYPDMKQEERIKIPLDLVKM